MKTVPMAVIAGVVLSVVSKVPEKKEGQSVASKPFQLVSLSQTGREGDARMVELKSYNGEVFDIGKPVSVLCELSCWAMKGSRDGQLLSGITATIIKPLTVVGAVDGGKKS